MARLLIRIAPNSNPSDPSLDALRTQPGDVVCIVEDDHVFSECERLNGQYRIIDVPGVSANDFNELLIPVLDVNGMLMKLRSKTLDFTALKVGMTTATKAEIDSLTVIKV